jgi:hypothetical protein
MSRTLEIVTIVLPIVAAMTAAIFGASQVRLLRKATGDRSRLTSILGGTWFAE